VCINNIFSIVVIFYLDEDLVYIKDRLNFLYIKLTHEKDRNRNLILYLEMMHIPTMGTFDIRGYSKSQNHFAWISFSSRYPKWMQKWCFVAKMSKLTAMLARINIFKQGIVKLASILLSCEYLLILVQEYIKLNYNDIWETHYHNQKL